VDREKGRRIFAVVVTYNPNFERLGRSVSILSACVERVIVVDNASRTEVPGELTRRTGMAIDSIVMSENLGVAVALNRGIERAIERGATHVLLMDHDSEPVPGMIDELVAALDELGKNHKVAAVGPTLVDSRTDEPLPFFRFGYLRLVKIRPAATEKYVRADHLMTSGTLVPVEVFKEVGPMMESLFIDYVDIEWCFRAQAKGYECFGVRDARLRHSLGNRTFTYRWFGSVKQSHAHSPFRYYYMCRNPWLFCRSRGLPLRVKISETFRSIERLLIVPFILKENRMANMRMMFRGIVDGVLGKGGALKRS